MPIRFRCSYCNQLMGIAHRKAGTVVRCPSCTCQVVVPEEDTEEKTAPAEKGAQPVFERSDFDEIFQPVMGKGNRTKGSDKKEPEIAPSLPAKPAEAPPFDVERVGDLLLPIAVEAETPAGYGIWVSQTRIMIASAVALLALTLAFGAGVMVGHFMR